MTSPAADVAITELVWMERIVEILLADLRSVIADFGKDGGLVSASVYDTAQTIRLAPPSEGIEGAVEWLLDQQQPDGGWGAPVAPRSRDAPTLAAILALQTCRQQRRIQAATEAALQFLRN